MFHAQNSLLSENRRSAPLPHGRGSVTEPRASASGGASRISNSNLCGGARFLQASNLKWAHPPGQPDVPGVVHVVGGGPANQVQRGLAKRRGQFGHFEPQLLVFVG